MYQSPIRIDYITKTSELISDIAKSMNEGLENKIMAKVQTIIDVDKEELIKALAYDRNQYEKGYKAGFKAAESRPKGKWLRHQAGLFDYHYCSICEEQAKVLQDGGGCELLSNYCPNCGADMRGEE